ncbi:DUF1638 domain-containing protein [Desulfosporosinus fructosivorans]|uniref:DUF1638 domain-containing protein n=2 Tax=Desulfosporosinus fructosivorans TaxID=2018669 RepID=A0A4Z0QY44_9FIRM|nr:DUF1638 domain-containing protein [Desulfosporosinus fructosivorans]TGE35438.1 DUF1638 domain-containing protein [Desulfosporosinus fructosivorans]
MKIKLIGCDSTKNEVRSLGIPETMDNEFLDFNYHGKPDLLHVRLQELIDQSQDYELIITTYSRCSNVVVGLLSKRVPLLLPKTHDCISLLLGSNERQLSLLKENPGTYYFSRGWLDYGRTPYAEYLEYVDRYGQKKATDLIKMLYGNYNKAVLIVTLGTKDIDKYREKVCQIADFFGWDVGEEEGDLRLLAILLNGKTGQDTVHVEPGRAVTADMLLGGKL